MTMNAKRRRAHAKLAALPGVRPVRRPFGTGAATGSSDEFDVYYVRTGRKSAHPLLVIPGGPGAASVALYRAFRRRAALAGLDTRIAELIDSKAGLAARALDGSDEEVSSSANIQTEALVALLTDALERELG